MEAKLLSIVGLFLFPLIAWCMSTDRKRFPWRTVITGMLLQFCFAFLILRTKPGREFFEFAKQTVTELLKFANEGASLVMGPLANPALLAEKLGPANAFILAVTVVSTIIVVSALSSLLYHWGILQKVVRGTAWIMQRLMRTSGSETLAAAANIFMGQTEAPLVIKPYLAGMTRSELMAMMTGGMATIAGSVLAAYVGFGMDAGHLLTASVMSAPASLLIAKIMIPETEKSETAAGADSKVDTACTNSIDAVCRGAGDGLSLSLNVLAMLIAVVALVAMANYLFGGAQKMVGIAAPVTFQNILGWLNAPFAWLMGVPSKDCMAIGQILGERIILNEFVAYLDLGKIASTVDPRSYILATYALCGFANFGSIAIQIGGISALAPTRRPDLARLGVKSMIGGLLACYQTATIVGLLIE